MVDLSHFPQHLWPQMACHPAIRSMRKRPRLVKDTSDFTRIDYGDVIHVDERFLLVVGYTREGRFGIDDQPKQWVPRVYDLESGERNIVKLVFHENYTINLGGLEITCYRTPEKEAKVIDLAVGNPYFMQGYTALDEVDNLVRILDIVQGKRLDHVVYNLKMGHRLYFEEHLASLLQKYIESVYAIIWLHGHGLKHGDIRRDHLFVDRQDGHFTWIDFDYDFYLPERPFAIDLLGLGSVLLFLIGKQIFRMDGVMTNTEFDQTVFNNIDKSDLALLSQDRIYNLQKLYPYIPDSLNDILLRFSFGTHLFFDSAQEFADQLESAIEKIW